MMLAAETALPAATTTAQEAVRVRDLLLAAGPAGAGAARRWILAASHPPHAPMTRRRWKGKLRLVLPVGIGAGPGGGHAGM